jgi:hypothetical protein
MTCGNAGETIMYIEITMPGTADLSHSRLRNVLYTTCAGIDAVFTSSTTGRICIDSMHLFASPQPAEPLQYLRFRTGRGLQ